MNQYNDVKYAKYWRDRDGNRHRVTPGDGYANSPTVPIRRKRSDEQVAAIRQRDRQLAKQTRMRQSYERFAKRIKRG